MNLKALKATFVGCEHFTRHTSVMLSRRGFLTGLTAGAGALWSCSNQSPTETPAQSPGVGPQASGRPFRVDTHHHFTPPSWLEAMKAGGVGEGGGRNLWSIDASLETMDRAGVQTAVISTGQFIWRLGQANRYDILKRLSREANEYGAKMVADHPGRYLLFAQLPLPDVDLSLKEIEYAFDKLHAVGVGITTNYDDDYIGDPQFAPILAELDRRKTIVYSHPAPVVVGKHQFDREEQTTRNIRSVLGLVGEGSDAKNGVDLKYPNITWLFSHAGGSMPMVIQRIIGREAAQNLSKPAPPESVLGRIRKFYCDTAQTYNAAAMGALKTVVTVQQILFGTDQLGAATADNPKHTVEGLEACGVFSPAELHAIYRGNAERLFPQLSKT
jgi:predicted TIM-barrel fold metal-dependent hydrolase